MKYRYSYEFRFQERNAGFEPMKTLTIVELESDVIMLLPHVGETLTLRIAVPVSRRGSVIHGKTYFSGKVFEVRHDIDLVFGSSQEHDVSVVFGES